MADDRVKLIESARQPIREVVEQCFEGMITKEEAFDKIALLIIPRDSVIWRGLVPPK